MNLNAAHQSQNSLLSYFFPPCVILFPLRRRALGGCAVEAPDFLSREIHTFSVLLPLPLYALFAAVSCCSTAVVCCCAHFCCISSVSLSGSWLLFLPLPLRFNSVFVYGSVPQLTRSAVVQLSNFEGNCQNTHSHTHSAFDRNAFSSLPLSTLPPSPSLPKRLKCDSHMRLRLVGDGKISFFFFLLFLFPSLHCLGSSRALGSPCLFCVVVFCRRLSSATLFAWRPSTLFPLVSSRDVPIDRGRAVLRVKRRDACRWIVYFLLALGKGKRTATYNPRIALGQRCAL
jgi:hypothetical protein